MEPKLKLKELPPVPSSTNSSMERILTHYPKPIPPSVSKRILESVRKLFRFAMYTIIPVIVFLIIPLRRWDQYSTWKEIQETLDNLQSDPVEFEELQRLWVSADSMGFLWGAPVGVRPRKLHQFAQRNHFDAVYGMIQILSLGSISPGSFVFGEGQLIRLLQRTGGDVPPGMARVETVVATCTQCSQGNQVHKCDVCGGSGRCNPCHGSGSITVAASPRLQTQERLALGGSTTRRSPAGSTLSPAQLRQSERQACRVCQGSGKCSRCNGTRQRSTACPVCGGDGRVLNFEAVRPALTKAINGTRKAVNRDIYWRYCLHMAFRAQNAILRRVVDDSERALSATNKDFFDKSPQGTDRINYISNVCSNIHVDGVERYDAHPPIVGAETSSSGSDKVVKFYLKWTATDQLFGPYIFASESLVGSKHNSFSINIVNSNTFVLTSSQDGQQYGPFEFTENARIQLPNADFFLVVEKLQGIQ